MSETDGTVPEGVRGKRKGQTRKLDLATRQVFTTGDVAKLLGVSARSATIMCDRGTIPGAFKLPGFKDRRVTRKSLVAYFVRNRLTIPPGLRPEPRVVVVGSMEIPGLKTLRDVMVDVRVLLTPAEAVPLVEDAAYTTQLVVGSDVSKFEATALCVRSVKDWDPEPIVFVGPDVAPEGVEGIRFLQEGAELNLLKVLDYLIRPSGVSRFGL